MANHVPVSPPLQAVDNHQRNTVHGQSNDGRIRVKLKGQNHLVIGTLSERRPFIDGSGRKKWFCSLIETTPGYQASSTADRSVIAFCPTTGKSYRIVGLFKMLTAKPLMSSHPVADASPTAMPVGAEQAQNQPPSKIQASNTRALRTHHLELDMIAAQRAAGLDPDLRMAFITVFVRESKANLYRKMGNGFPYPIKRGKGSFWPMSQIEAYKAGQSVNGAA
jgi:hypothetical protein